MLLCEAAGFDTVLVETVGVGQSETAVRSMVDFFLLLMLPGAGDELQGIKRGIIEMVDAMAINKADGENRRRAERARAEYASALHLFPVGPDGWVPPVLTCSALTGDGLTAVWEAVLEHRRAQSGERPSRTAGGRRSPSRGCANSCWRVCTGRVQADPEIGGTRSRAGARRLRRPHDPVRGRARTARTRPRPPFRVAPVVRGRSRPCPGEAPLARGWRRPLASAPPGP